MAAKSELKVKLSLKTSEFSKGLNNARRDVKSFGFLLGNAIGKAPSAALRGVTSGFALTAAAAAGVSAALVYQTRNAYKNASALQDMSDKTGILAGDMRVLQQAAKDNGIEDIVPALSKMQAGLAEAAKRGIGPTAEALGLLGLNAQALLRKAPLSQMEAIGKAIGNISNPALKASAARGLFGKSGTDMLPMFADPEALEKARKSVGGLAKLYNQNAAGMDETARKIDALPAKSEQFFSGLAAGAKPAADTLLDAFNARDFTALGTRLGMSLAGGIATVANYVNISKAVSKGTAQLRDPNSINPSAAIQKAYKFNGGKGLPGMQWKGRAPSEIFNKTPEQEAALRKKFGEDFLKWDAKYGFPSAQFEGGRTPRMLSDFLAESVTGGSLSSRLTTGGLTTGGLTSGNLAGGAYGGGAKLSKRERDAIMDAQVAAGGVRPNGAIKRGDAKRREEFEKQQLRGDGSVAKTNALLTSIDGKL